MRPLGKSNIGYQSYITQIGNCYLCRGGREKSRFYCKSDDYRCLFLEYQHFCIMVKQCVGYYSVKKFF